MDKNLRMTVSSVTTLFGADKFSRIFAQKLNLRKFARKLVPNFQSFLPMRKFIHAKNFYLHILKKSKSCVSKIFARNRAKISTEF